MIALLLVLGGCTEISNAAFTEDATYLAPLPSAERFAPPWVVSPLPESGDALAPPLAREAGDELQALLAPLVAAGEALRETPPDTRTEVSRAWSDVLVASSGEEVEVFHARAGAVQTWEGLVEWTLEGQDADGEWVPMASGRGFADGSGELSWDLVSTQEVLDVEEGWDVSATWEGGESRFVRVTRDQLQVEIPHEWLLYGQVAMLFTGYFDLEGESLPGVAGVAQLPEGGRGRLELYAPEDELLEIEECWDPMGAQVWLSGDVPEPAGDEGLCAVEPFEW